MHITDLSTEAQTALDPLLTDPDGENSAHRVVAPARLKTSPAEARQAAEQRKDAWRDALDGHAARPQVAELRDLQDRRSEKAEQLAMERQSNDALSRWLRTVDADSRDQIAADKAASDQNLARLQDELADLDARAEELSAPERLTELAEALKGDDDLADVFDVTRRRNAPLAPEGTDIDQLTADLLVSELTGVRLQGHLGDATFDEELATMASEGHVFDDGETFDVIARMGDRLVVVQLEVDDDEFAIAQLHVATVSDVDATVYGDKATLHVPRGPLVLDSPVEDVPALVQLLAR